MTQARASPPLRTRRLEAAVTGLGARDAALSVVAGLSSGVLCIIFGISYGTLAFAGPLSFHLREGLAAGVVAVLVLNLAGAARGSLPWAVSHPQPTAAIVIVVMGASISRLVSTPAAFMPTVLATVALTSIVTGTFFFVLGAFHLGKLVRFVPFAVAGGFQAGIGWLMGVGSIKILTGTTVSLGSLNRLVDSSRSIEHMVPAVLLAAALWFSTRYSKHFFAMLALLLASGPLFYLALAIAGVTTAGAKAHGWLLGPLGGGGFYQPLSASEFHLVSWPAVLAQTGGMATIMIVASTGLLLNVTRLEVAVKHDVDVDQELRILGIGNIVNGIAGGLPGFHSTTASLMAHRIGHGTRLVGIVAAGTAAVVLLLGTSLVAEIPRFIVGGFLLFLGLQLLIQWVVRGWSTMARLDYAVLCAMLIIIGTKGFLVGTLAGVLLAIFLFVITYSRAGVVKHELTGETYQSNVDRSLRQQHVLRERGNSLYILTLQGFLFFGTSTSLLEQIRRRMDSTEQPPVRCMVLDCHLITGVDASLGLVFGKIRQLAIDQGAALALAGVPHSMFRVLRPDSTTDHAETGVQVFPDVDRAVEWAEDRILDEAHAWDEGRPILDQLSDSFQPPELAERVMGYFDRSVITAGDQVVRQGEPSNSLYIVESGKLSVVVETSEGKQVRLRSSTAGALLGELGFFLGTPRTASVVATEPSVLYRLTRESLERMQADDPPVAAAFNAFVTRLLAHRVVATTQTVTQLTA